MAKLMDRLDDIPPLAEYFIEKYSKANSMPSRKLTAGGRSTKLKSHPWPGNVRELENIMHRAVLMAQGNSNRCRGNLACPRARMLRLRLPLLSPISVTTAANSGCAGARQTQ